MYAPLERAACAAVAPVPGAPHVLPAHAASPGRAQASQPARLAGRIRRARPVLQAGGSRCRAGRRRRRTFWQRRWQTCCTRPPACCAWGGTWSSSCPPCRGPAWRCGTHALPSWRPASRCSLIWNRVGCAICPGCWGAGSDLRWIHRRQGGLQSASAGGTASQGLPAGAPPQRTHLWP